MSRTHRLRRLPGALLIAAVALLVLAPAALAGVISPESESPNAESIATLYRLILVLAIIVFVGVEGALLYSMLRYRARKGAVAAQIHGNTRLEIGWTVGAFVVLLFITVVTFLELDNIKNPAGSDIDRNGNPVASAVQFASTDQPPPPKGAATLNIRVDGQQYVWRYQYPGPKTVFAYQEMVVPVGMTVTLDISADDVAHSWWIPALGGKMDAVPGYINHTWFKATKPGTYRGQCAELCGRNHANMFAVVRAVPFAEYQAWYDRQADDIKSAREEAARQRKELEGQQGEQAAQGGSGSAGGGAGGATQDQ